MIQKLAVFVVLILSPIVVFGGDALQTIQMEINETESSLSEGRAEGLAKHLLDMAQRRQGVCCFAGCRTGELAVALAQQSELIVFACDEKGSFADQTRQNAAREGVLGRRVYVDRCPADAIPLADHLADLLIIADWTNDDLSHHTATELLRVVSPERGVAIIGLLNGESEQLTPSALTDWAGELGRVEADGFGLWAVLRKPPIAGADDWTHWHYGPSQNPVSDDTALAPPLLVQWREKPVRTSRYGVYVSAGGRLFGAQSGELMRASHVPYVLTARNLYNGQILWKRPLPKDFDCQQSLMVAVEDALYLADGEDVAVLDAETGQERTRIALAKTGQEVKRILLCDGLLIALCGQQLDRRHGWLMRDGDFRFEAIVRRQFDNGGRELVAYDLDESREAWRLEEEKPIDTRSVVASPGRLFYLATRSHATAVHLQSGEPLWRTPDPLGDVRPPRDGGGVFNMLNGLGDTFCTEDAYYLTMVGRPRTVALDAACGRRLWDKPHGMGYPLAALGRIVVPEPFREGGSIFFDPRTGEEMPDGYAVRTHTGCGHASATTHWIFGQNGGAFDLRKMKPSPYLATGIKAGCGSGVLVSGGVYFATPNNCGCADIFVGPTALTSAGDFEFDHPVDEETHLETPSEDNMPRESLEVTSQDWPTYRANNARSASTPVPILPEVKQLWRYQPKFPYKVWPVHEDDARYIHIDEVERVPTPPVTVGGLVFVGGADGVLTCLNASTGQVEWTYATGGRIYSAPSVWNGRVFIGSADGYVYTLEAATGRLLWQFLAAPVDRRIMVQGNLVGRWPVTGGVVVRDGVLYAAAGVLDQQGVYVYALDAKTGRIIWQRPDIGHADQEKWRGFAANGRLAVAGGKLWMSQKWHQSAVFDLAIGEAHPHAKMQFRWTEAHERERGTEIGVVGGRVVLSGCREMIFRDQRDRDGVGRGVFAVPIDPNGESRLMGKGDDHTPSIGKSSLLPAWNDDVLFTLLDDYTEAVCCDLDGFLEQIEQSRRVDYASIERWRVEGHVHGPIVNAFVLGDNAIVLAVKPSRWQDDGWRLEARDLESGEALWTHALPMEPIYEGLAIDREGRILIVLLDGSIVCMSDD